MNREINFCKDLKAIFQLRKLKNKELLRRVGPDNGGVWEVQTTLRQ